MINIAPFTKFQCPRYLTASCLFIPPLHQTPNYHHGSKKFQNLRLSQRMEKSLKHSNYVLKTRLLISKHLIKMCLSDAGLVLMLKMKLQHVGLSW